MTAARTAPRVANEGVGRRRTEAWRSFASPRGRLVVHVAELQPSGRFVVECR
jgi:hypothetical protein